MNGRVRRALVVIATVSVVAANGAAFVTPAYGVGNAPEKTMAAVELVAPSVLSDLAPRLINATDTSLGVIDANNTIVSLPRRITDDVTLNPNERPGISIRLASADPKAVGTVSAQGVGVYPTDHGYSAIVAPKKDGSVQIGTLISNARAPQNFDYALTLAEGSRLVPSEDGYVLITDAAGHVEGGIAPAWAVDANGRSVPTTYIIDGNHLTQVVDHLSGRFAYPIFADPWLGIDLVSSFYWTHPVSGSLGYRINISPTLWARSYTGNAAAPVVGAAGWDELYNKQHNTATATAATWRSRMNDSMRDQYICHMMFGAIQTEWNLEQWSPNNGLSWHITHECQ